MTPPNMNARAWAMLITLSILWGGSFFFVEVAVADIPTFTLVLFRVGIAAITLWIWLAVRRQRVPLTWTFWRPFFIMALVNNAVPFSLFVWGQSHIASGLASILNASTPFFTVILASLAVKEERITFNRLIGVALGFVGVVILIGPDILGGLGGDALAQLACLGGALSYAIAGVFARKSAIFAISPETAATAQLTAASFLLVPVVLLVDGISGFGFSSFPVAGAVLALAIASTAYAYVLYFRILAAAGAVNLLLVTFLVPLTAVFLGAVILGEILSGSQIAGALAIVIALAIIDGRLIATWTRSA